MKKLFIVLAILASLGAGIIFYLRQNKLKDFEPLIKQRLSKLVVDASHGLYQLDIGELQADVIGGKLILTNARLRPDTTVFAELERLKKAPNDLFDITISQLSIDDIVPADFIANKTINLGRLFINKPIVTVYHKKQPYNVPDDEEPKTLYQQIQKDVSSIKVDTLILQNIDFIYKNTARKDKLTRLLNIKVVFADILIDSSTQADKERVLFAKSCLINLKDYTLSTSDSLYRLRVGEIDIQTLPKAMQLKKVQFLPRGTINNFYKKIGHQQDRFELSFDQVNFSRVEWWEMLAEESLAVKRVQLVNGSLKIFNDKSQPIDTRSKIGKYPHQILMNVPLLLTVDSLAIRNLDLSYTELNPKSGEKGTLHFSNIEGLITNITNEPAKIKQNAFMRVSAKATFMKQAAVKAAFEFNLGRHKSGVFKLTASMGPLQGQVLNNITVPLGLLKINSLQIKSLDASIRGDNYKGSGTVKMIYNDLNITALKTADDTLKKRRLLSFIANAFVIKKDNPLSGSPVRVEIAAFDRNTQRSFFNLVWKTIFTGAGKTVGYKVKK
ncbi:MAG: hypothetical protein WKF89_10480 [Chitinophagaceae bacterium]